MATARATLRRQRKIVLALIFLLSSIAVWNVLTSEPLPGFWVNIFDYYVTAWVMIVGASLALIWIAYLGISWSALIGAGFAYTTSVGSISLVYGVPFTAYDAWNHLGIVRAGEFQLGSNPYPAFHLLLEGTHILTGFTYPHLVAIVSLLAAYIGVVGLALLINEVPATTEARRVAFVALLPVIFLGFVSRPFTLAWVLVPFWFWVVFRLISGPQTSAVAIVAMLLLMAAPFLHPMLLGFATLSAGVGALLSVVTHHRGYLSNRTWSGSTLPLLSIMGAVLFIEHMLITSGVGGSIIQRTVTDYLGQGGPSSVQQAATGSGPFAIFTSLNALTEAILRLSLSAAVSIAVLYSVIRTARDRVGILTFGTAFVSATLWVGGFLILLITLSALGVERIVTFTPLVLAPIAVRGFSGKRVIAVTLAICCLTTGLLTVYPSGHTGSTGYSASETQVAAVEWTADYRGDRTVTGTTRSWWIGKAFDRDIWRWGMRPTSQFPWLEGSSNSLTVILANDIAGAEHHIEESGRHEITAKLTEYKMLNNKVYSSSGGSVYDGS